MPSSARAIQEIFGDVLLSLGEVDNLCNADNWEGISATGLRPYRCAGGGH